MPILFIVIHYQPNALRIAIFSREFKTWVITILWLESSVARTEQQGQMVIYNWGNKAHQ